MFKKIIILLMFFGIMQSSSNAMEDSEYSSAFENLTTITRQDKIVRRYAKLKELYALGAKVSLLALDHLENFHRNLSLKAVRGEVIGFTENSAINRKAIQMIQNKLKPLSEAKKSPEIKEAYKYILNELIKQIHEDKSRMSSQKQISMSAKITLIQNEFETLNLFYQKILHAIESLAGKQALTKLPKAISFETLWEFSGQRWVSE